VGLGVGVGVNVRVGEGVKVLVLQPPVTETATLVEALLVPLKLTPATLTKLQGEPVMVSR
jgi:hypothetical protein